VTHPPEPGASAFTARFLRAFKACTQKEFARAAGLHPTTISRLEKGRMSPRRSTVGRLAAGGGLPLPILEELLLPLFRSACSSKAAGLSGRLFGGGTAPAAEVLQAVSEALLRVLGELSFELSPEVPAEPGAAGTPEAAGPLARLLAYPPAERPARVAREPQLGSWVVCVLVCEASVSAAADKAPRALELAQLALFIAERVSGSDLWRVRLQGYAWVFVGNARRVGNDLLGAERAFVTARSLWEAGAAADPGVLDASRVLDLEASLRRDQRRWTEALALLDQALALSPNAERTGRILLNKALTHEQRGDCEEAIAALAEAAPLVDRMRDPRQTFGLRFNWAVNLCHLGRYAEAAPLVAEARELAVALRNDTDLVKVLWLEGRVHAGLGRRAEAIAALRQVREDFAARELAGDAALATLNLAVVLLEEGRTGEVRALAGKTVPIFGSLGLGEEALAALSVFWRAAEQETATAELGRRLLAFLERARYDPDLRFDPRPRGGAEGE